MFDRPSINEVREALKPLANIPRPDTDNEGDPINGDSVFPYLSPKHQQQADHAAEILYRYVRNIDGEADRRALTTLTNNGFQADLNASQYDQDRLVGRVTVGEWEIDVSDPRREVKDD